MSFQNVAVLIFFKSLQISKLVWGPPGGRRWQTLGKLDCRSESDEPEEAMEVDTDDQSEDDFKTSFEEQVSQLLHLTLFKPSFDIVGGISF